MASRICKECFPDRGWIVLSNINNIIAKYPSVLAGGTALALRLGHRISNDLDFFMKDVFSTESLIASIRKTGLSFNIFAESEGTLVLSIEGLKVSFFSYEYGFIEKPLGYEGLKIAGILDIASMKVIAILQRGSKRDFIDLFVILQRIPFQLIAEHMIKRFGKESINPLQIGKSLVYFRDADLEPEPIYPKGREIQWDAVKGFFRSHIRQLVFDLDAAMKD